MHLIGQAERAVSVDGVETMLLLRSARAGVSCMDVYA